MMVAVDEAVIARLRKAGHTFEILVDCDAAMEYRSGKHQDVASVVATQDIFSDVKKGLKAKEEDIKEAFGTADAMTVAAAIVKHGDVQLTTKHREQAREEKRKRIVSIIHSNAIDSATGLPHPPQRIEAAMQEAGVHVDENKRAEDQVEDILKKLRAIIPIKFERKEIEIKIPSQFAGQAYGVIKKHKVIKDEWLNDGSLLAVVELPSGIVDEFFATLNKLSHGEVESKILQVIG